MMTGSIGKIIAALRKALMFVKCAVHQVGRKDRWLLGEFLRDVRNESLVLRREYASP